MNLRRFIARPVQGPSVALCGRWARVSNGRVLSRVAPEMRVKRFTMAGEYSLLRRLCLLSTIDFEMHLFGGETLNSHAFDL